jgi:hypothetical protein
MKHFIYIIFFTITILSCKNEKKVVIEQEALTIAQKIANAHGFQNWDKVSRIEFTFNVDRDSSHFERSWVWVPKTNEVVMISKSDTISYKRTQLDSTSTKTDKAFINDKYWLLAPFNLAWDKGTTISEPIITEAPISKKQLNKITLTYSIEGGYTPGDAYDFYYDNNFLVQEWIYRRQNSENPSLISTWENYQDFNGLKIATEHNKLEGHWNLNFTNIKVYTKD